MSYVNNKSYGNIMSYINNMSYVNDMNYVSYMSIFMSHLKSNNFFKTYKDEFETQIIYKN